MTEDFEGDANGIDPLLCQAKAWHGAQCRNNKKDGTEYCKWHSLQGENQRERAGKYAKATDEKTAAALTANPDRWGLRCDFVFSEKSKPGRGGEQCGQWAMNGLTKCKGHAQGYPGLRELGEKVMEDRKIRHRLEELAELYGMEGPIDNPLLAMQQLSIEVVSFKDFLLEKVKELDRLDYSDAKGAQDAKAIVQLYERALDRTTRLMADMAKLKIDERLAAVSERQGELVATVLERVLENMDLGERKSEARNLLTAEFKRIQAA